MSESPSSPDYENLNTTEGTVKDFDLLPKELGVEKAQDNTPDELGIRIVEPLSFDYEIMKKEVQDGNARLRLVKDGDELNGFSVITTPQSSEPNIIRMLWTNPKVRGKGIGKHLILDAINKMPRGEISMDIWGGEPMEHLAQKLGFTQNAGKVAHRFTFFKK